MAGRRRALIVAVDEYEHPGLGQLRSPGTDADALGDVLGDPQIGGFEVDVIRNQPSHEIATRLEDLFYEARPDDVLLVHFSGHGLKGEAGDLFFAARNTRPNRLASTAVPADFVQRCVRTSPSRSIVLFLDCCYGGAFSQGVVVRAAGDVPVLDSFPPGRLGGGRGRAVITASNAMEYAFEGERLSDDRHSQPSPFTAALVQGLRTGEADRDEDGFVSLNELYDYVFDRVKEQNPNQTPSRDIEMQGELYVAKSRRRRLHPAPLPADLRAAVEDANPYTRLGAVAELRTRLTSDNLPVAASAHEALTQIAGTDTRMTAEAAQAALAELTLRATPDSLTFTAPEFRPRRIELSGPPLARQVTVEPSDPWIRIKDVDAAFEIGVFPGAPVGGTGSVTFAGLAGAVTVALEIRSMATSPSTPREPPPVRAAPTRLHAGPEPQPAEAASGSPPDQAVEASRPAVASPSPSPDVLETRTHLAHDASTEAPPSSSLPDTPGSSLPVTRFVSPLSGHHDPAAAHADQSENSLTAHNVPSRWRRARELLGFVWLRPADRPVLQALRVLHVVTFIWFSLGSVGFWSATLSGSLPWPDWIGGFIGYLVIALLPVVLSAALFRAARRAQAERARRPGTSA